jgi:hypothetical protein
VNATPDPGSATGRVIVGAFATLAGGTGLLAAIGFLVQQSQFVLVGLPSPPLATTDYLRIAGLFFFDVVVLVILVQAVKLVLPALLALFAVAVCAAVCGRRVRVNFKEEKKTEAKAGPWKEPTWQTEVRARDWYLLGQNDQEIWLFRRPIAYIVAKDQIGVIKMQRRDWFLGQ